VRQPEGANQPGRPRGRSPRRRDRTRFSRSLRVITALLVMRLTMGAGRSGHDGGPCGRGWGPHSDDPSERACRSSLARLMQSSFSGSRPAPVTSAGREQGHGTLAFRGNGATIQLLTGKSSNGASITPSGPPCAALSTLLPTVPQRHLGAPERACARLCRGKSTRR
jgi:hypothetical protein